ncbi:hypothetical protein [Paenibacillus sp. GCM10027626]|uniref:hypothetical protein n=1 Tax=Paenibacillus sp. GCM10027626 TaxID=3273411 RepID=UPI003645A5C0
MTVQPGDIYCFWDEQLGAYGACQITHMAQADKANRPDSYAALTLHWTGSELPAIEDLQQVKPLVVNFYYWRDHFDHTISEGPIPSDYTYISNLPVLVEDESRTYGGWSRGYRLYRQLQWESISTHRREPFKMASGADISELVEVGGVMLPWNTRSLSLDQVPDINDYTGLDRLSCLSTLTTPAWNEALESYLTSHPFINKLELALETAVEQIDLQHSPITELTINVQNVRKLLLPDGMDQLTLSGSLQHKVHFQHGQEGCGITLRLNGGTVPSYGLLQGIPHLEELELFSVAEIDLGCLINHFPSLHSLRLWGKPGCVHGMDQLSRLTHLRMFTTMDMFGFTGEQFPQPAQLPELQTLWMTSLPEDAAKAVKQAYKQAAKQGLDLSIRQPRKPEWLADNLDNPFRSWDGREGITAAQAKKAAALYKQIRGQLRELSAQAKAGEFTAESAQQHLEQMLTTYIEGFNKLDKRKVFIYTEEREEIFEAISPLVSSLVQEWKEERIEINEHALWELTDQLRDF